MYWIISYDVPNDKRRAKIAKLLEGFGRRVQYSVFECEIDLEKLDKLHQLLLQQIEAQEDDVRIYPLNQADLKRVRLLGRAQLARAQRYYLIQRRRDDPSDPF